MTYSHLDTCIKRQALKLNRQDELIKLIAEYLNKGLDSKALELAENHVNNIKFTGKGWDK